MPESPDELYARAHAAADSNGRLPMPPVEEWETFPFEGDMRVRPLDPPADEPPRDGEDAADCWRCRRGDAEALWSDEHWRVVPFPRPAGLPVVVLLEPREHVDLGWDDVLPPTPEAIWREHLATVAQALAETGGTADA